MRPRNRPQLEHQRSAMVRGLRSCPRPAVSRDRPPPLLRRAPSLAVGVSLGEGASSGSLWHPPPLGALSDRRLSGGLFTGCSTPSDRFFYGPTGASKNRGRNTDTEPEHGRLVDPRKTVAGSTQLCRGLDRWAGNRRPARRAGAEGIRLSLAPPCPKPGPGEQWIRWRRGGSLPRSSTWIPFPARGHRLRAPIPPSCSRQGRRPGYHVVVPAPTPVPRSDP